MQSKALYTVDRHLPKITFADISKNEIEKTENWHISVFLAPRQANILFETANYVFTKLMLY